MDVWTQIAPRRLIAEVPEIVPLQISAEAPELLGEGEETTENKNKIKWWTSSLPGRWDLLMRAERTTSVGGFIVKMDVGTDAGEAERGFSLDSGAGFSLSACVYI